MAKEKLKTLDEKLQAVLDAKPAESKLTDITIVKIGSSELNPFELLPSLDIKGLPGKQTEHGYYDADIRYLDIVESFAEGIDWFIVGGFVDWGRRLILLRQRC